MLVACGNCNGTGEQEQYGKSIQCSTCDGKGRLGKPDHPLSVAGAGGWQWYHYVIFIAWAGFLLLQYFLFFPQLFGW